MSKKDQEEEKLPGLSLDHFKAAVEAVVASRDTGELLPFLARVSAVRLIGSIEGFRKAFGQKLGIESVEEGEAREALREIQHFLGAWSALRDLESLLGFLENVIFDDEFEDLPDEGKARFRTLLESKAEHVRAMLFTPAMAQRAQRIRTLVGASLEDLDVEVLSARRDELQEERLSVPFLRLRLRYSEGVEQTGHVPIRIWDRMRFVTDVQSFELEADEADIDLLLHRLIAAKELLLKAVEGEAKPAE